MLVNLRAAGIAALAVLCAANLASAQAPSKTLKYETSKPLTSSGYVTPTSYSEVAPTPADTTPKADTNNGAVAACSTCPQCEWENNSYFYGFGDGAWFGGVEFLLIRPHFSEADAYLAHTDNAQTLASIDETVSYKFGFNGSVRAFLGYRLCDCGGEIRMSYWNFNMNDGVTSPTVPPNTNQIAVDPYSGQLEVNAGTPGSFLRTQFMMDINSFDVDFAKRIPLGDCSSCCPLWDLTWSAGFRVAQLERHHNVYSIDAQGATTSSGFITTDYLGAGPRMGLEGRRYFSDGGLSAYMKGNLTMLLGDYSTERKRTDVVGAVTVDTIRTDDYTRMVPVFDLEFGLSWQVRPHFVLTAGYMYQAWFDLGMFEEVGTTDFRSQDDSNIMSFDGLMLRAEFVF